MSDEFIKPATEGIERVSDDVFSAEVGALIDRAEETRLNKSKQYSLRSRLHYNISSTLVLGTITWFAWTVLMGGNLGLPLLLMAAACVVPIFMSIWANQPKISYIKQFKLVFMPQLAKSMAKLHFHPTGGISLKAIMPSRIVPASDAYEAEDCFRGKYKGVNLMISEARMYSKKQKGQAVFRGILVFLHTPEKKFTAHTIITADHHAVKRYKNNRWKQLKPVTVDQGVIAGKFMVFSSKPEEGRGLADQDFMELLNKLSLLFDKSAISAAFYGGNRVLMMIPNENDMFEPGDIYMPFTSKSHALKCKREVEQILNIVDVLNVYEADSSPAPAPQETPAAPAEPPPPPPPPADVTPPPASPPEKTPEQPQNPANAVPPVPPPPPPPAPPTAPLAEPPATDDAKNIQENQKDKPE